MKKSVRNVFYFIVLLVISVSGISAQETKRVVILDLEVESENPSYKFLGKGFAEFIAVELSAVEGVAIIDREKRNDILEEQKFSQSGLSDESTSIELGNLLAANYLISGSIFDMFGQLEVTLKLTDIELGTAAVQVQAGGEPKQYKAIVSELADRVAEELSEGLSVSSAEPVVPEAASEAAELDNEKADIVLASFSEAMDAVDRNDRVAAKEKLKTVQKVDRTNEAARYYLNKLQAQSPKFRVEMVEYVTPYSAASLGFIESGKIYFWLSAFDIVPTETLPGAEWIHILDDDFGGNDATNAAFLGISMPVGESMGIGAGLMGVVWDLHGSYIADVPDQNIFEYNGEYYNDPSYSVYNYGAYGSFGISLTDWLGIGCSVIGYMFHPAGTAIQNISGGDQFAFSVYPGLMIQSPDGNIVFDLNAVYTNAEFYYADTDLYKIFQGQMPVVIDSSITVGFPEERIFVGLKGVGDIYIDGRQGHALRLIPMAEWWPAEDFSVRAGYEYSHLYLSDVFTIGHGAVGGATVRLDDFDINANVAYRQKPVRLLPGYTLPDIKIMVGIEYSPEFLER